MRVAAGIGKPSHPKAAEHHSTLSRRERLLYGELPVSFFLVDFFFLGKKSSLCHLALLVVVFIKKKKSSPRPPNP